MEEGLPRLSRWERWPGVLQLELGEDVLVIEEGLNGRTTVFEDPYRSDRVGLAALPMLLDTHAPLDAVLIMLATNDLLISAAPNAYRSARGVGAMVELIRERALGIGDPPPGILVVVPPPFGPLGAREVEIPRAREESRRLSEAFREVIGELGVPLVDLREHVTSSSPDGIHFQSADHAVIGRAVAIALRPMLDN